MELQCCGARPSTSCFVSWYLSSSLPVPAISFPENITPEYFAWAILGSATVFTLTWFLDALTHSRLGETDITARELHTHRVLILTSGLMELSLLLMYWFDYEVLPVFLAAIITRTAHEFIDELHWH